MDVASVKAYCQLPAYRLRSQVFASNVINGRSWLIHQIRSLDRFSFYSLENGMCKDFTLDLDYNYRSMLCLNTS